MPRPRFERLDEPKKNRILETSAREFANHGYDGASLNHILSEAGISKGAAYYYFDDKADLFATVVNHYWNHILGHADLRLETLDRKSFWPKVHELYRQQVAHAYEQPWLMPLFRNLMKPENLARLPHAVLGTLAAVREWTGALLRRGQELGVVRSDLPLDLLLAVVMGADEAADRWMYDRPEPLGKAESERILRLLLEGVQRLLAPPERNRG
jgi:AcrR family transcriptional regulator